MPVNYTWFVVTVSSCARGYCICYEEKSAAAYVDDAILIATASDFSDTQDTSRYDSDDEIGWRNRVV